MTFSIDTWSNVAPLTDKILIFGKERTTAYNTGLRLHLHYLGIDIPF